MIRKNGSKGFSYENVDRSNGQSKGQKNRDSSELVPLPTISPILWEMGQGKGTIQATKKQTCPFDRFLVHVIFDFGKSFSRIRLDRHSDMKKNKKSKISLSRQPNVFLKIVIIVLKYG